MLHYRPAPLAGLLPFLLLAAAGCSGSHTPPGAADPALRAALDAWQNGEPPDSLAAQEPAVRVIDDDWLAGLRLQRYELQGDGELVGTGLRCPVVLHLRDSGGQALPPRQVVYEVST